jgi:hypothetical protein
MINSNCYKFEKRKYNGGFFDSFLDATYIITMTGSNRNNNYEKQLREYIPTKYIYIVHNEGYKKCTKYLYKQETPYDLIDANLNIMNHSLTNNYNNILILEDDFIFNSDMIKLETINEIKTFFYNNQNKDFYFNLGPVPFLYYIIPNKSIYRGIYTLCNQGVIYKKNIIKKILNDNNNINKYSHIDNYIAQNYIHYFYKTPLIIQTFPTTENQKNWGDHQNKIMNKYLVDLFKLNISIFKINSNPMEGWYNLYNFLFIINYLFLIIIIIIIFYICKITNYIYIVK